MHRGPKSSGNIGPEERVELPEGFARTATVRRIPEPRDVSLVIEVANSSRRSEVWIVHLAASCVL